MGMIALFFVAVGLVTLLLLTLLLKWLWNITMPDIFKINKVKYWQAFRLLLIASILFSGIQFSQSALTFFDTRGAQPNLVLTGIVTDAETGQPIEGAKVSDYQYGTIPYKGAVTDSAGRYRYITWATEHNIIAEAPGYKSVQKTLITGFFETEKEKVLNFKLKPEK